MMETVASKITRCQKCGKPIQFVRTNTGKLVPVTAGLKKYHPCEYAFETFIDIYGRAEHGYSFHDSAPPIKIGYQLHDGRNCYEKEWENEEFRKRLHNNDNS